MIINALLLDAAALFIFAFLIGNESGFLVGSDDKGQVMRKYVSACVESNSVCL